MAFKNPDLLWLITVDALAAYHRNSKRQTQPAKAIDNSAK